MTDIYQVSNYTPCQIGLVKGERGENGTNGANGINGKDGKDGKDGLRGLSGSDGKSNYQLAIDSGFIGSLDDYLVSIKGDKGDKGDDVDPSIVDAAIAALPFEGGVLADTFVTVNNSINQRQVNMGFDGIDGIEAITGANIGMRVYSKTHASNFIFKATSTSPVNDGTVLQGIGGVWEMEDKSEYLASWFATPDIEVSQTDALQAGYDYATSKGKPFVIDDNFWVAPTQAVGDDVSIALIIRGNSNLQFTDKGKLRLITNNSYASSILFISNVSNFKIYDPDLEGDRLTNNGARDGEWGHAIKIYSGAKDGYIHKPRTNNTWGDGISIGVKQGLTDADLPTNITIFEPHITKARRNGISIVAWNNVKIIRPLVDGVGDIDGVAGKFPKACIDIEIQGGASQSIPNNGYNGVIESPTLRNGFGGLYAIVYPSDVTAEMHIKGRTYLENIATTGFTATHSGNSKGSFVIDELYYATKPTLAIALGWNKDSKLTLEINKVTRNYSTSLNIDTLVNALFTSKKLGNVTIRNIDNKADVYLTIPNSTAAQIADPAYTLNTHEYDIDGYIIDFADGDKKRVVPYKVGAAQFGSIGGKDTKLMGAAAVLTSNTNVEALPNNIVANNINDVGAIYVDTANDFRHFRVEFSSNTPHIKTGMFVRGLKIRDATGYYTTMNTVDPGAWIEYQNIESGFTRIISIGGEWVKQTLVSS